MMKQPKFKQGDKVGICIDKKYYLGTVYIVDPNGTFEQHDEPSYDIMVENMDISEEKVGECLIKHCRESNVMTVENYMSYVKFC